ncbi:peptidase M76 family-domain-containing protein [Naematelia encephala]|uniref:Mitochondrial inner membrane protease ATP23 n=1 Tax=Naematelia encephala TaxID=71784 RepID=A0A1Y2BLD1_9TREE|nr:peptidase M76 family-domain-containing protein [Naematelia encephala]
MAEAGPSTSRSQSNTPSAILETAEATPAFERWRSSLAKFTGLGLNQEEKAERDRIRAERLESRQYATCEKWKSELVQSSPIVVFMLKHLKLSGCAFPPSAMQCFECPDTVFGGFNPEFGVLLCQNRLFTKSLMEDTLAHELIHAFDHCKFNVNPSDLRHQACTEIRAANLSGDCRLLREWDRGNRHFYKQHQACVRRRAVLSLLGNPSCENEEMAERAVNEVWESCSKDTRPFDEVY